MHVKKELMEILACPKCRGGVKEAGMFMACPKCKLAYPILDGDVPDMVLDDAWALAKAKKAGFKHDLTL